jgi:hypothetical protein
MKEKKNVVIALMIITACLMSAVLAFPHHGTAIAYDGSKTVTMKGTVTEFVYKNPHIQIYYDVKDEKGNVVRWAAEGGGVYFWSALGFRKDSLKPGDQITISVHPSRAGVPMGELAVLEMPNGKPVPKMGLNAPVE